MNMRNTEDIPEKEFKEKTLKLLNLLKDPYRKALQKRQDEIYNNPNCNEWTIKSKQPHFGMKPEFHQEWETINEELELYRRNLYPELLFPLEYDNKLKEVNKLKKHKDYINLVKGLKYFAKEIDNDEKAIIEIKRLNQQISELIEQNFPDLFKNIPEY